MTDVGGLSSWCLQVRKRNWRSKKKKNKKDLISSWHLAGICTASVRAWDLVSLLLFFYLAHNLSSLHSLIPWTVNKLVDPAVSSACTSTAFSFSSFTADGLAKKFGLTPEQFGENLRDSYQRHETEQFPAEPVELAKDYVCSQFTTPEAVLEGTRYMVAMQIAREPLVRHVLRQTFQERAKINIKPTKKGKKVWTHLITDI